MSMTATETTKEQIPVLKELLRRSRKRYAEYADVAAPLDADLQEKIAAVTKEHYESHAEIYHALEGETDQMKTADATLREALVERYNILGEKRYDEDLSVRVTTKLEYETEKAVAWAEANAPVLIVKGVDKKAFASLPIVASLEFVHKIDTVTAVIAKDLK